MKNALNCCTICCLHVQNAAEKHKPETRVSVALKPGFRVWENDRVSPGPGIPKTLVSIPNCIMATETGCEQMNVFFLWYRLFWIVLDILVVVIVL